MRRSWLACIEEFEAARDANGVLGAVAYVSTLVVVTLIGLVILVVLGVLALILLPLAMVPAMAVMFTSGPGRVKPTPPDPWLSE